jgi:hypothetical protein
MDLKPIPAIAVNQWLDDWEKVTFDKKTFKSKPQKQFYLVSLKASLLRRLSDVQRRQRSGKDDFEGAIQRRHDPDRSEEIQRYVQFGHPVADWSDSRRAREKDVEPLQKPGWLPTGIVINILGQGDQRKGRTVAEQDRITVESNEDDTHTIHIPAEARENPDWLPQDLFPLEVIDGQHRLWAFDEKGELDYELPVVAFNGLDLGWQAYLFWSINVKPKKISPSLAFDLYPLLRQEEWLEKFEGHQAYRETRAQLLVEWLWDHPESPWHHRINMLGDTGLRGVQVTQSAWVRALVATFVKGWKSSDSAHSGGLFGAYKGKHEEVLGWSRHQQVAFLILMGKLLHKSIKNSTTDWALSVRQQTKETDSTISLDSAFTSPVVLLNNDQGIRELLDVVNILFQRAASSGDIDLQSWEFDERSADDRERISEALDDLTRNEIGAHLAELMTALAEFDWRTSAAVDLSTEERDRKLVLRGSSGYSFLRRELLAVLQHQDGWFKEYARAEGDSNKESGQA